MEAVQDGLTTTHEWFEKAVPNPTPMNQSVQLGVHFEEIAEMGDLLLKLRSDPFTEALLLAFVNNAKDLAQVFKRSESGVDFNAMTEDQRIELLDSLLDQIVTATGTGYMNHMDIPNGLDEVNRANYSKFDEEGNPIFDENGKVKKGPRYVKPSLDGFV